ncbi:MAG: PEP-CTERM sorting domain-containing protein [Armatimonadota bacterium]
MKQMKKMAIVMLGLALIGAAGVQAATFSDNFDSGKNAAWVDLADPTTAVDGKLLANGGTNEVIVGGVSVLEPTIDVDMDASAQGGILTRLADTSSFLLLFYSPVQNTIAYHEKVSGNWGGWLNPVWNANFTKTGTIHLSLSYVGNTATTVVSDGVNSVTSVANLSTLHSAGFAGLYHDSGSATIQNFDNFSMTYVPEPSSILALGMGLFGVLGVIRRRS